MIDRYMKKLSMSLIIREMQIKTKRTLTDGEIYHVHGLEESI